MDRRMVDLGGGVYECSHVTERQREERKEEKEKEKKGKSPTPKTKTNYPSNGIHRAGD